MSTSNVTIKHLLLSSELTLSRFCCVCVWALRVQNLPVNLPDFLQDLDDLDADLFGGKYNKKKSGSGTGTPRQRTPRTPRAVSPPQKGGLVRSSTPTSPPGSASGSRPVARVQSPPQQTAKPSTAPGNITGKVIRRLLCSINLQFWILKVIKCILIHIALHDGSFCPERVMFSCESV